MSEGHERQSYQFPISFLLSLVLLAAASFAGARLDGSEFAPDSLAELIWSATWIFFGPLAAASVLLIGRAGVAVPMAIGILCGVAIGALGWMVASVYYQYVLQLAYLLGSLFGILRLLFQKVTLAVLLLAIPVSAFVGAWLAAILRMVVDQA